MTSAPYLYSVPMNHPHLRTIEDWTDQSRLHRAVMSLFPTALPGAAKERRAESAILYRTEPTFSRVLIQSLMPMTETGDGIRTSTLAPLFAQLERIQRVRVRVDINAVRVDSRTRRRVPVADEHVEEWLRGRLAPAFTLGERIDHESQVRKCGNIPLHTVLVSAQATTADHISAVDMLTRGVGRARAYGCGLVSIAPIG